MPSLNLRRSLSSRSLLALVPVAALAAVFALGVPGEGSGAPCESDKECPDGEACGEGVCESVAGGCGGEQDSGIGVASTQAEGALLAPQAGLQAELQDQIFRNTPPIMGIVVSVSQCPFGCGCYGGPIAPNTGSPGIATPGCPAGTSCFQLKDHTSGSRKLTLYKCGNMGTFPPSSSPCTGTDAEIWQCVQSQTGGGWSQEWRVAQM